MNKPPYSLDFVSSTEWEFFYKYLALSPDQQEQLQVIVDSLLVDRAILPE